MLMIEIVIIVYLGFYKSYGGLLILFGVFLWGNEFNDLFVIGVFNMLGSV